MSISNSTPHVNEKTALEHSILATLCYFNHFDFPLTPFEIWKYLLFDESRSSFFDVVHTLETSSHIQETCGYAHGMYFLKGNESHVWKRHDRYIFAERKCRKALAVTRVFARLPFVRMVAAVNTLAFSAARDGSDIDFLIVVKAGRLWFARALATVCMQLAGKRPRNGHMRDAICLSFFLSDDSLNLSSLQLPEKNGLCDLYLCAWVASCVPLYSEEKTYERFYTANAWTERFLKYRSAITPNHRRVAVLGKASIAIKKILERGLEPFSFLERIFQHLQLTILPSELRETMNKDTRVVLTSQMIKCHPNDRREEVRLAFLDSYQKTLTG